MRLIASLAAGLAMMAASAAAAAELLMIEEAGCVWCARWNDEIGGIYDRTEEGRRAPLRRVDIAAQPEAALAMRASFTPTFVLLDDGREIGRIEGYPGPDFFWPMLDKLLDRLPARGDGAEAGG